MGGVTGAETGVKLVCDQDGYMSGTDPGASVSLGGWSVSWLVEVWLKSGVPVRGSLEDMGAEAGLGTASGWGWAPPIALWTQGGVFSWQPGAAALSSAERSGEAPGLRLELQGGCLQETRT